MGNVATAQKIGTLAHKIYRSRDFHDPTGGRLLNYMYRRFMRSFLGLWGREPEPYHRIRAGSEITPHQAAALVTESFLHLYSVELREYARWITKNTPIRAVSVPVLARKTIQVKYLLNRPQSDTTLEVLKDEGLQADPERLKEAVDYILDKMFHPVLAGDPPVELEPLIRVLLRKPEYLMELLS